jgi:hypothetical protein
LPPLPWQLTLLPHLLLLQPLLPRLLTLPPSRLPRSTTRSTRRLLLPLHLLLTPLLRQLPSKFEFT